MKRVLLAVTLAVAFLMGYAGIAKAWPGVSDRDPWHGYFTNIFDDEGDSVINGGYPLWVNSADSFIGYVENQLYNGASRDRIGAAFTIQLMIGNGNTGWSRINPPTAFQIADWESRVRLAANSGWITWSANFTYTGNSYWQGNGAGPNPNDDAFYYENGTRVSMIFRNGSGDIATVIKRDCGNPLTNGYMPGLQQSWSATGRSTVQSTAAPGQTVTFQHYVKNNGPTAASLYWATLEGAGSAGTGLGNPSSGPDIYTPGQERNVKNENFTIPMNAAAGTQYCREVGWDPVNSGGARNGRGTPACVTVVIPAKLKASMSATPPVVQAGDTTNFNPVVSATTNASPTTVNCTIVRTTYAPGGGATGSSSLPCVDSSGNSNINVPSGTAVNLKPNPYTAPDTVAIGSKVCDVITITNPTDPAYYVSYPADATAQACVVVAKTPLTWFMGNDVWAGGGFATATPACNINANITTTARQLSDGSHAGSVSEYAAFALGQITNFGSAGKALVDTSDFSAKQLTFANSEADPTKLGYYGASQHCINDYYSKYSQTTTLNNPSLPGSVDVGAQGSGVWRVSGNHNFHGTMPAGATQVYIVENGEVTVDGDLKYPTTYGSAAQIPSLVIISYIGNAPSDKTTGSIQVLSNVQQMDGVFVAKNRFITCDAPATQSVNTCNKLLTVNGAVLANQLELDRTAGADGSTPSSQQQPAENFNFNPEVYLHNALNNTSQTTITTTNETELPPRY